MLANKGVDMDIIMKVVITSRIQYTKSLNEIGNMNSTEYMSLLNLFMIRPIGVDSKNCIVECMIDTSMLLSSLRDDLIIVATEQSSAKIEQASFK